MVIDVIITDLHNWTPKGARLAQPGQRGQARKKRHRKTWRKKRDKYIDNYR